MSQSRYKKILYDKNSIIRVVDGMSEQIAWNAGKCEAVTALLWDGYGNVRAKWNTLYKMIQTE